MVVQKFIFQRIRELLPSHLSFVHDIATVLEISYDSAYRRMRGEKELTVDELIKICNHYNISADDLLNIRTGVLPFSDLAAGINGLTLEKWLETALHELQLVHSCKKKELIYSSKDIPIFHFFEFPEIAAFKIYFWKKMHFQYHESMEDHCSFNIPNDLALTSRKIMTIYRSIPTTEIWTSESVAALLRQVFHCYSCGCFTGKEDAIRLTGIIEKWIKHLKHQADIGFLFEFGKDPVGIPGCYKLYRNEFLQDENTVYITMDDRRVTYLTYNIFNLLITANSPFCCQVENSLRYIIEKSTLISGGKPEDREQFFNSLLQQVSMLREQLINT